MRDGRTVGVTHAQGAYIQAIIDGEKEPINDKQREFVANSKRVVFEPVSVSKSAGTPVERQRGPIDNAEFKRIRNDESLTGIEKLRATINHIKSR